MRVPDVADHPDHPHRDGAARPGIVGRRGDAERLTDRAARRPEPRRERLADQCHRLGPDSIARGEPAAVAERNPQHVEIVRADGHEARAGRGGCADIAGRDVADLALLQRPCIGEGHARHARELTSARRGPFVESAPCRSVRIGTLVEGESGDEHIGRIEAHVHAQHAHRALNGETGAHQQRQAGGDLHGNEDGPCAPLSGAVCAAFLSARQGEGHRRAPDDPDGQQRAHGDRQQTCGNRERGRGRIDLDGRHSARRGTPQVVIHHGRDRHDRGPRECEAQSRCDGAQKERFRGARTRNLCGTRPKGLTDSHLAAAAGRAYREQHADVGARDQQDEPRRRGHGQEQRSDLLHIGVMGRPKLHAPAGWQPRRAGPNEGRNAIGGGRRWDAFAHPHEVGIRRRSQRRQDLREDVQMPVAGCEDADHGEGLGVVGAIAHVSLERPAEDRRIAIEARLPQAMADEHRHRTSGLEVGLNEPAPEERAHGKPLDITRRDPGPLEDVGIRAAAKGEAVEVPGQSPAPGRRRGNANRASPCRAVAVRSADPYCTSNSRWLSGKGRPRTR